MAKNNSKWPGKFPDPSTDMKPPPDKRRKMEHQNATALNDNDFGEDNLWDDQDDIMFTQENIDAMMGQSQVIESAGINNNTGKSVGAKASSYHNVVTTRTVGRGTTKSRSSNDALTSYNSVGQQSRSLVHAVDKPKGGLVSHMGASVASGVSSTASSSSGAWSVQEVRKWQQENEKLKKKLAEMELSQRTSLGRINILQNNMTSREAEIQKIKQEKIEQITGLKRDHSEKEKSAQNEITKMKSEMQFIKHELEEMNMKQKTQAQVKTPQPSTSRITNSPNKGFDFSNEFKASVKPAVVKGTTATTVINQTSDPIISNTSTNQVSLSRLKLRNPRGNVPGSGLVRKLMQLQTPSHQSLPNTVTIAPVLIENVCRSDTESFDTMATSYSHSPDSGVLGSACSRLQQATMTLMRMMSTLIQGKPGTLSSGSLLQSDTDHAVQFLPTIQDTISTYISVLDSLQFSMSSQPGGSSGPSDSPPSMETGSSSDLSLPKGVSARFISLLETQLVRLLEVLVTLVMHSMPVCQVLIMGYSQPQPIQPTQTRTPHTQAVSNLSSECLILHKLCHLANPKLFDNCSSSLQVCALSLQILTITLEHCPLDQLQRLSDDLPIMDVLLACISEDIEKVEDRFCLGCGVLRLIHTIVRCETAVGSLCTVRSEDCILDNVYHFCVQSLTDQPLDKSIIHQSYLMQILSRVLTHNRDSRSALTTANCHCGLVIDHLLTILHHIYKSNTYYDNTLALSVLHQGASILQNLAAYDTVKFTQNHETNPQYVEFVYGMEHIYKTLILDRESTTQDLLVELRQDYSGEEDDIDISSDVDIATTSHTPAPGTPSRNLDPTSISGPNNHSTPKAIQPNLQHDLDKPPRAEAGKSLSKMGKKSKLSRDKRSNMAEPMDTTNT